MRSLTFFPRMWASAAQTVVDYPVIPQLIVVSAKNHKRISAKNNANVIPQPALRVFELKYGGDAETKPYIASIAIDLDNYKVFWPQTTEHLFGKETGTSTGLGAIVWSAPLLLAMAPVLATARFGLHQYEKIMGMNRYAARILMALEKQVSVKDYALLERAFKQDAG